MCEGYAPGQQFAIHCPGHYVWRMPLHMPFSTISVRCVCLYVSVVVKSCLKIADGNRVYFLYVSPPQCNWLSVFPVLCTVAGNLPKNPHPDSRRCVLKPRIRIRNRLNGHPIWSFQCLMVFSACIWVGIILPAMCCVPDHASNWSANDVRKFYMWCHCFCGIWDLRCCSLTAKHTRKITENCQFSSFFLFWVTSPEIQNWEDICERPDIQWFRPRLKDPLTCTIDHQPLSIAIYHRFPPNSFQRTF